MRLALSGGVVRSTVAPMVRALSHTWRFRVRHADRWCALRAARTPFVFLLWHEAFLPLLWLHRHQNVAFVVSDGREGRYLSDYATRLGYQPIPGSSSRGGARALRAAVRALHEGTAVAVTPDGPRGPRREVKPGLVRAAQRAGVVILPLHAVARPAWRVNSWDRLMVPLILAHVDVGYGESFSVGPGDAGLGAGVARCAEALESLERELGGDVASR